MERVHPEAGVRVSIRSPPCDNRMTIWCQWVQMADSPEGFISNPLGVMLHVRHKPREPRPLALFPSRPSLRIGRLSRVGNLSKRLRDQRWIGLRSPPLLGRPVAEPQSESNRRPHRAPLARFPHAALAHRLGGRIIGFGLATTEATRSSTTRKSAALSSQGHSRIIDQRREK